MKKSVRELPDVLIRILDNGIWPTDELVQNAQYEHSLVDKHVISEFFDHESETLILYRPPFSTALDMENDGMEFIFELIGTSFELEPNRLIILGDFGLGSDAFFGLYYLNDIDKSLLIVREKWSETGDKLG